jgi:aspartyl-tRNA(Asn)/glutamyl-tRNA(Gln) amidotransferase subunit B
MSEYDVFIGLEIHIHLSTESKMFCGCRARFGDAPNANVCPVCMGWPGVLPELNAEAVDLGYRVARAMGCELSLKSLFDRKAYFYSDMPKNYQISQFHDPIGRGGSITFPLPDGSERTVRMRECHLEEDAGKMIHAGDISLLDYNRAGYPLLEIVTEPDLRTGEEAEAYLHYFQRLVRYLGVCDGNMEEGSLRCDANISINKKGAGLGTKVEMKNLNSSRFVKLSLNYEADRQAKVLDSGEKIPQETRLWNENRDCTLVMRTKESSHDYRFFPEPDLPPFCPDQAFLSRVEAGQCELPLKRMKRLEAEYGLTREQAEAAHETRQLADFFEECARTAFKESAGALASLADAGRAVATWLIGDVRKELNRAGQAIQDSPLTPSRLASLVSLLASERIHGKIAKQVLSDVFAENADPEAIIERKGLEQLRTPEQLKPLVDKILAANAEVLAAIAAGDVKKKEFLIGRVMAESGGRAAPTALRSLMEERFRAGA